MPESMMLEIILRSHFITLALIAMQSIKLYHRKQTRDAELRYFWMTLICCFLLVLEDVGESIAAANPFLRSFRVMFSALGYSLRPIAAIGLLLVVCPPEKRTWKIWIPAIVNCAVYLTAFFSPVAFSYDADYSFIRGPLGYSVFLIGFLYMFQVLVATWHRFHERKQSERWLLVICAASCIIAAVIDVVYGGCRLNEAIMISSVFFYIFLRSHDNRLDPLTALDNRFALYDDIKHHAKNISGVASLDMNGLKRINDTLGHAAGDRALSAIGHCLGRVNSRNTVAYRIGGDEFLIVFRHQDEAFIQKTLEQVKADVTGAGYSISVGYAVRTEDEGVDQAIQRSDQSMYRDKAAYYQQSSVDRRKQPDSGRLSQ